MSCCAPLHTIILGLIAWLILLIAPGQSAEADAGTVDTGFGTAGYSRPILTGNAMDIKGMTVQPDGKILLVGSRRVSLHSTTDTAAVVIRLNADGSLDTAFGSEGEVRHRPVSGRPYVARFVEVLADNRLLVAGVEGSSFFTFCLAADGTVDANYNSNPVYIGLWEALSGFGVLSNGQGIALCHIYGGAGVYRLNLDGTVDETFAGTGHAVLGRSPPRRAEALLVMPDDTIVVGMTGNTSWTADTSVHFQRLLTDGSLDLSFRGYRNDFPSRNFSTTAKERVKHLGLDTENNLLALCELEGEPNNLALLRITPEGDFDSTWGTDGAVITRIGDGAIPIAVQSQADGRVLVLAQETLEGAPAGCLVARFLWNGLPDTSFGEGGVCVLSLNAPQPQAAFSSLHQKEGRILLAATAPQQPLLEGGALPQGPLVTALHAGAALPVPEITIVQPPQGQNLTMVEPLNLTVTATGPEGLVYTWYRNGGVVARGFQPGYLVPQSAGVDEGSYFVEVRHGATAVRSEPVNVVINQAAQIGLPRDAWGIEGSLLQVSFGLRARKPMTVRWFKDDVEVLEETYDGGPASLYGQVITLTLNPVKYSDAGQYHIEVTNADGTVTSAKAKIAVGDDPTVAVVDLPGGYVINVGETLSLQPSFYSNEAYKTQWYKNGAAMAGQNGDALEINEASMKDAGVYTVRMTNSLGRATSPPMAVSVADTRGRLVLAVPGKKASLSFPVHDKGISYEWFRNDELLEDGDGITGSRAGTLKFEPMTEAHEGDYHCLLTQGSTQISTGNFHVEAVTALPQPEEITLPAGQVGISYATPLSLPLHADKLEVRGLPPGLVYSAEEAEISGKPTKAGTYKVTITTGNPLGKASPQLVEVVVAPFREERTGRFYGILTGGESQGSLDVTITSTGSYSGKLSVTTLQGVNLTQTIRGVFRNQAVPNPHQLDAVPVHLETVKIKNARVRMDNLTPSLALVLDDGQLKATLVIGRNSLSDVTQATCLPCPWKAKSPLPSEAPGIYNLSWSAAGSSGIEGSGYGRATITAAGNMALTGRVVDGTAFILAAPLTAELACNGFTSLYGGRGAVTASYMLELDIQGPAGTEPGLSGDMYWAKRLENGRGQKVHPYNHACAMEGAGTKYFKPGLREQSGPLVMDAPSGENNVQVTLMDLATLEMTLKPNQSLDIANETENVAGLKACSFNAATGLFTARGVLDTYEEKYDPRTDVTIDVLVPRQYTVQGIVTRAPGWRQGTAQGFGLKPVFIREGEGPPVRISIPMEVNLIPKGYGNE